MPYLTNDHDPPTKHNVSYEWKNISAKRLYRGVVENARKLDAGRQHRRNLISFFQPEQVKLRYKLRESCERLLFTYPCEYGRKAEELLWRKVFYDVILAIKTGRKFQSNAPGSLQQRNLEPYYQQFLYSASGFYHYLLLRLQTKTNCPILIDLSLAVKPLQTRAKKEKLLTETNNDKTMEEIMKSLSYKLLVCLGDISRYQIEFGVSRSQAFRYYELALISKPEAGIPHNQLATLMGHNLWWGLHAAYHYFRALHAESSFTGAEGNLQKLLDRNRKLFYQLPSDALTDMLSTEVYKKEHTRIFIISFLYLCDLLRPRTYSADAETNSLCKKLIDALYVCLNNTADVEESNEVFDLDNHFLEANESKSYSKRGHHAKYSERHLNHQHKSKLNNDSIFKLAVLCLVNVEDLQSCRSNRFSAAIAFTLAFFSHLLGHIIQKLHSNTEETKSDKADKNIANKADGDHFPVSSKHRSKKSHLKRRRCLKENDEGDLSEGEDTLAGGDCGSHSDLSESETYLNEDSDSISASSGSDTRLSQEDLSSAEEDKMEDKHKINSLNKKETVEKQNIVVESLQDLSQKMFQNRRKITLAPSFLQPLNLLPKKEVVAKEIQPEEKCVLEDKENTNGLDDAKNGNTEKSKRFKNFENLSKYPHLIGAIKLLADWVSLNDQIVVACMKSSSTLWSRLVCLANLLPTEQQLMQNDEIQKDQLLNQQLQFLFDETKKVKEKKLAKEIADKEEQTKKTEPKIRIEKRKQDTPKKLLICKWQQNIALPEDYVVYEMKAVKEASKNAGVKVVMPYKELKDIQQNVIRTCRIRHLCRWLSTLNVMEIEGSNEEDHKTGEEIFVGPEEEVIDPSLELEAVESMRKTKLMKDMAASRLRSEVKKLEASLKTTPQSLSTNLCLYLVPDATSLSQELGFIRRLVASERYFVIVPKVVIDSLDSLKKECNGSREAIKYLELQFNKGNKFLRPQINEKVDSILSQAELSKLRRQDIKAWKLESISNFCLSLIKQQAEKSNTQESENKGIVTILTLEKYSETKAQENFSKSAKQNGIQIKTASKVWESTFTKSKS